jgi:hypothetical protein
MEVVVFHVSGPGLDGGAREATAPVSGPGARSFPLTLVLVGPDSTMAGPYQVAIEGRRAGQAVAEAVRTDGQAPVAFSPGKVMRYRYALRALGGSQAMPQPTMPPDAGTCTGPATCAGNQRCACAAGCACSLSCGPDHCMARCDGAGTTCEVDVSGAHMANVQCAGGAACLIRGIVDKGKVHLDCAGQSQDCGDDVLVCNRSCP